MGLDKGAYGEILFKGNAQFAYSRLPNVLSGVEFFITTKGLVVRGGPAGPGDLLIWDNIKEINTTSGKQWMGLDIKGTVRLKPLLSFIIKVRGSENFAQMSSGFYRKVLGAWSVAKMFPDGEYRSEALKIWGTDAKKGKIKTSKGEYLNVIYTDKIKKQFRGNITYKNAALEMYERGKLKAIDFEKTDYEIEKMVKEYIKRKCGENAIGFKTSSDTRAEFMDRIDSRESVKATKPKSTSKGFYSGRYSDHNSRWE